MRGLLIGSDGFGWRWRQESLQLGRRDGDFGVESVGVGVVHEALQELARGGAVGEVGGKVCGAEQESAGADAAF